MLDQQNTILNLGPSWRKRLLHQKMNATLMGIIHPWWLCLTNCVVLVCLCWWFGLAKKNILVQQQVDPVKYTWSLVTVRFYQYCQASHTTFSLQRRLLACRTSKDRLLDSTMIVWTYPDSWATAGGKLSTVTSVTWRLSRTHNNVNTLIRNKMHQFNQITTPEHVMKSMVLKEHPGMTSGLGHRCSGEPHKVYDIWNREVACCMRNQNH